MATKYSRITGAPPEQNSYSFVFDDGKHSASGVVYRYAWEESKWRAGLFALDGYACRHKGVTGPTRVEAVRRVVAAGREA